MFKKILIAVSAIALFACTSPQEQKSLANNDWQALGGYHGQNGMIEFSSPKLQKLSDRYGNGQVDYPSYQQGYDEALIIYCQPENAIKLGGSRKTYLGVCDRFPHGNQFRRDWEMIESFGTGTLL